MTPNEPPKDEGARSFSVLLASLEDGALHGDLSQELLDLNRKLVNHAEHYGKSKGKLTLTLQLSCERGGMVRVDSEVAVKPPKALRAPSMRWITNQCNLTAKNPRQLELGVREVPPPKAPREVPAEERPAKDA
jgi:hypothetical protein